MSDSFEVCRVAPFCWNHWRTLTTSFRRSSAVQNLQSTWTFWSVLIVTQCTLLSSNQNYPTMPCLEIATQAVHFRECNGICRQCSGHVLSQKMLFLEFTLSKNRKYASSENQTLSWSTFFELLKIRDILYYRLKGFQFFNTHHVTYVDEIL